MKIATFNINGITRRLENLIAWLGQAKPDIVCLQELKAADGEFPRDAIEKAGYSAVWQGQAAWNGVAILSRDSEPVLTRVGLEGDPSDKQSRYIEAAVSGILVACLYAPNGNPQPGPKFAYKLSWHDRLLRHASDLYGADLPVVLAGDYNIVPEPRDIYPTRSYDDNALVQPESRAAFRKLLDQGWLDALRKIYPQEQLFTFWDYRRNRWQRDAGLRLDHILLSHKLSRELIGAGIDRQVRGVEGASDHAPVWITLRD
ncbi:MULTISPECIES: exodeoxyribonuclease III [unclassified Ensifer]|uniref:exodeoxyribonuclease III n=1 Tax=unclassified Ensifer TaxID=2633371 RepID=UPI0008139BAA|nr:MULTISPECIES: exodeoxyribonuclease III [unclassified Ensifer]OCO98424.1 exodeoxyribonuclease III [Ensifer sp. LC11]OCP05598.1 exodeoxyribonuclease III [Ensifer sp. LC13]OCP13529.1 exodeoxyribonuclease III [Ensifer sp. LC14]OCP30768.1 exodeoxyribonuclease III [Ensifer sp. LC499]